MHLAQLIGRDSFCCIDSPLSFYKNYVAKVESVEDRDFIAYSPGPFLMVYLFF